MFNEQYIILLICIYIGSSYAQWLKLPPIKPLIEWEFETTSKYQFLKPAERASNIVICHNEIQSCRLDEQYSLTKSTTYKLDLGVSFDIFKLKVQATAGIAWTDATSVANTKSFTIHPGQTAYVAYAPRFWRIDGNLKRYEVHMRCYCDECSWCRGNRKMVESIKSYAEVPVTMGNGQLDGEVSVVITGQANIPTTGKPTSKPTEKPDKSSKGKKCRGTSRRYDQWCKDNCAVGNCPKSHCKCK